VALTDTDMHIFAQAFPDRFLQMGMAEQLLFGAAAGMAETGLIPFASTYSVFAARRAYDFICLDIAEPSLNVNIVGGLPGLTTGYGPSHQATEDVAIFRGGMRVLRSVAARTGTSVSGNAVHQPPAVGRPDLLSPRRRPGRP
jgi:transketolase C-terminal domain/subunit